MLQHTKAHKDFELTDIDDEQRIMTQLTYLDSRLRGCQNYQSHIKDYEQKLMSEYKKEKQLKKWQICENNTMTNNPLMEYFSEIGNQQVQDDSLFDPQNNFLAFSKHTVYEDETNSFQKARSRPKKKQLEKVLNTQFFYQNSSSQPRIKKKCGILKDCDHINQKQIQLSYQITSNQQLPLKKPTKQQKQKNTNINKKKLIGSAQDSHKSIKSNWYPKDNDLVKYIIQEEKQSSENDQQQFRLTTFELEKDSSIYSRNKNKCKHEDENKDSLQCTFKPTILRKSDQMINNNQNVVERLSTSVRNNNNEKIPYQKQSKTFINRKRIEELSQPKKIKTQTSQQFEERPSFKPSLSKKSLQQMSNCTYDVATRNQLWLEQKQEKIERLRQEEEQIREKKEDCTYSPALCTYKGEINPQLTRYGKEGMANYFGRVSSKVSKSRAKDGKQNIVNGHNVIKDNMNSKVNRKQRYDEAVKQLHNRIMNLKI